MRVFARRNRSEFQPHTELGLPAGRACQKPPQVAVRRDMAAAFGHAVGKNQITFSLLEQTGNIWIAEQSQ